MNHKGFLAATALLVIASAAGAATSGAPLDTLHVVAPPSPYDSADAHMGLDRNLLPDIEATKLPRARPPQLPPRLDDPLAGEYRFLEARRAARGGDANQVQQLLDDAWQKGSDRSRLQWWQLSNAVRNLDPATVIWILPRSVLAAWREPLAGPRLLVLAHQAVVQFVAVLWTVLVGIYLAVYWRYLAHDLGARLLREHKTHNPRWLPLLVIAAAVALRPGWFGLLAILSVPLVILARGRNRQPLLAVWLIALALVYPNWQPLRQAVVALDPQSETVLLQRAVTEAADPALMAELRSRLAKADDPARRARLQVAMATQEARRGRFTASNDLLREALGVKPQHVPALVAMANNAYFQSRHDDAVAGYQRARDLAPQRGEIPFNLAQVYFKKLFLPEAGQALQDSRKLGFAPPPWKNDDSAAFSPVAYLGFDRADLLDTARLEAANYPPLADLAAWNAMLATPPLPPFLLLGGLLVVALLLAYWTTRQDTPRTCENCGEEICSACDVRRDGQHLCHGCGETALRARSGMVMTTLLKNRSRSAGLAHAASIGRLARWLPGSGHLAIGEPNRAACRAFAVAVALFLIYAAWAFDPASAWRTPGLVVAEETVHPFWLPLPAAAWPGATLWPLGAGAALLVMILVGALVDAANLRQKLPERLVQGLAEPPTGPHRP